MNKQEGLDNTMKPLHQPNQPPRKTCGKEIPEELYRVRDDNDIFEEDKQDDLGERHDQFKHQVDEFRNEFK
ncbi:hypothetical protein ABK040_009132 [Willaertia magna]